MAESHAMRALPTHSSVCPATGPPALNPRADTGSGPRGLAAHAASLLQPKGCARRAPAPRRGQGPAPRLRQALQEDGMTGAVARDPDRVSPEGYDAVEEAVLGPQCNSSRNTEAG